MKFPEKSGIIVFGILGRNKKFEQTNHMCWNWNCDLKNFQQTKIQTRWLHWITLSNIWKVLTPIIHKFFQNFEDRKHFQTHSIKPASLWYWSQIRMPRENYRPISLMYIHAKTVNKTLANKFQEHSNRILYHDQMGLIPKMWE